MCGCERHFWSCWNAQYFVGKLCLLEVMWMLIMFTGICSKHYYRPSTPIAGYILQNTKPQILRNGFRNATRNTRCWSSLHTPLKESTYNVRVENTTEPHCPYLSMQVTQKCVVLMLRHFFLTLWVLLAPLIWVFWVCTLSTVQFP